MKSVSNVTALKICIAIHEAGGKAYIVGGLVRDMLVERNSIDWDIECFGLDRPTLEAILNRYAQKSVDFVGAQYGVYKIDGDLDVSFPRRDLGHGHGAEVEIKPDMSIEDAARRRDLTINAIYFDPITAKIIDPFHGRHSLFNRVVRHVSDETFHKDQLRPVRAARFAALLGFDVDFNTTALCRKADPEKIDGLPKERTFGELKRVLMEAPKISVFFEELEKMGLLARLFPELHSMKGVEQGEAYHPEGNVYNHTMLALDSVPVEGRQLDVMLAILFHDLGKPLVPNEKDGDKIHFKGHAEALDNARSAILRLTNEEDIVKSVLHLCKMHMRPYDLKKDNISKKLVRRLAGHVDMRKLLAVHRADREGRGLPKGRFQSDNIATPDQIMDLFLQIENEIHPIIKGRHLIDAGFIPGDHFGVILRELFERQLDEQFDSIEGGVKMAHTLFGSMKKKDK